MKRIAVITLTLIMIMSVSPAAAFADDITRLSLSDVQEENIIDTDYVEAIDAPEGSYDGFIVALDHNASKAEIRDIEQDTVELVEDEIYLADSIETLEEIADNESIDYIEPNYTREITAYNDTYYTKNEDSFELIKATSVWSKGIQGKGLNGNRTPVVAVIDSGLTGSGSSPDNPKHEDINYSNILTGYNYNTSSSYSTSFTDDDNGHGTFVTGEIAAAANNGKGVAGLMSEVKILPMKSIDRYGSGNASDLVKAIYYAVDKGADVINMSLGSQYYSRAEEAACDYAVSKGVIVVAAAGNYGTSAYSYPASYPSVISVASVGKTGSHSVFSQYNDKVDVAATGESIYGLGLKSYGSMSGTSMACPVVSALAAMVKSIDPNVTAEEFRSILKRTSVDKGDKGYDNKYGYGIVDYKAVYEYLTGDVIETSSLIDISQYTVKLAKTSYAYTGLNIRPAVTVGNLSKGSNYEVAYSNNRNVGTATVTIKGIGKYTGTVKKTFKITKAVQDVKVSTTSVVKGTPTKIKVIKPSVGTMSYKSSNTSIATISSTGVIKGKKTGTVKITVKVAGDSCYKDATKTVSVKITKKLQTVTVKAASSVKVKATSKISVNKQSSGKTTFTSSNNNVATVSSKGVIKGVKAGTVKIKVKVAGNSNYEAAAKTITVKVIK